MPLVAAESSEESDASGDGVITAAELVAASARGNFSRVSILLGQGAE